MKVITLTEANTEKVVKVLVHNIKQFYSLELNKGQIVTVIDFMDGSDNYFKNPISEVELLINNCIE